MTFAFLLSGFIFDIFRNVFRPLIARNRLAAAKTSSVFRFCIFCLSACGDGIDGLLFEQSFHFLFVFSFLSHIFQICLLHFECAESSRCDEFVWK